MSNLPLSGIKLLDLCPGATGHPCAEILRRWGAEHLFFPNVMRLDHPEGQRILLMLVQEADVLIAGEGLDVNLLHEYNPMLIVCDVTGAASPWMATSAVLAALRQRERTGQGRLISLEGEAVPCFGLSETDRPPGHDAEATLSRLGYAPEAIAALRRDGLF